MTRVIEGRTHRLSLEPDVLSVDALAAERRRMPRMAVDKDSAFDGPDGPASLLDLFDGRRQLIVYRYFFEPGVAGWPESGCRSTGEIAELLGRSRPHTLKTLKTLEAAGIVRWVGKSPKDPRAFWELIRD